MFWIKIEHKSSCDTNFLIYSKNITNLLFWVLWTCLTTSIKKWCQHVETLFMFMQKRNSIPYFFLRDYKDIANLLLSVLWGCLIKSINYDSITLQETLMFKVLNSTCTKLWRSSACKSTSSVTSFLRYCKDIANLLFWELWECLTIPIKIIVSICSKLSCLSASHFP